MSAILAVDDVVQIVYRAEVHGQTILTVLHARVDVAGTGSSAEEQLEKIATVAGAPGFAFLGNYMAASGSDAYFDWCRAQKVKPTRTIYAEVQIDNFGGYGASCGPQNIAASIEKQSLKVGRSGVGRVQIGTLPEGIAGANIDSAFITANLDPIAAAMSGSFLVPLAGPLSLRWCLPAGGADHDYDIWNAIPKSTTRTMHRRTVGLGI